MKVVRIIARLNVGGPARHTLLLSRLLRSRGFETILATGEVDLGEAEALEGEPELGKGVRIERVPGLGRRISPRDDLRALAFLVKLLRRERPLVVHTHTAKAGTLGRIAAWIAGVPVVVHTFHGHVLSGYFGTVGSALARAVERTLALATSRIVVLSASQREELSRRFRVAPLERFRVIPLGRDLSSFGGGAAPVLRSELELDAATPLLGFVGRLVPIKDPETLLRALSLARGKAAKAVVAVCGSGPLEAEMRARAKELGLEARVRFLGWRTDLAPVLASLDALVLSSRNEGTPLAIIEAFASGKPVVSTAVGGVPDMFSRGEATSAPPGVDARAEGVLVPPGDPGALARALELLLDDDDLRRRAGLRAREAALRYGADRLADDIAGLYRAELARTTRGRLAFATAPAQEPDFEGETDRKAIA